ncbi:MAG: glycoside hydrolase family 127 protein [Promethearchaeota archaeon]
MQDLHDYPFSDVTISDPFWDKWMEINLDALYYQWEQLEKTKCIDNFRIAAGKRQGFREGWFFSDSDAYKWLDAAARYHKLHPHKELLYLMNNFIQLIKSVQMEDGYINTYNQIFFPSEKWINLWIEHELYCLGHLIEAMISLYQTFNDESVLQIATKAADLIVRDFMNKDGTFIPGHQEIEIALLKLYEVTQNENYSKMSEQFLTRRGDVSGILVKYLKQAISEGKRAKQVKKQKNHYISEHPKYAGFELPGHVVQKNPPFIGLRWINIVGSGRYGQQHTSLQNQLTPEGHSVRYVYTQTAMVHLHRLHTNKPFLSASTESWKHMIEKRTFPTGGLGSIPAVEGWGNDYELNGEYAYCETCAAIGSLLWNWQLLLATKEAKYADFFEWQLYNAVLVGIGMKGNSYLYRNPLISKGGLHREPWYQVPCCPSNLSRTFADLGGKIIASNEESLYINQFISGSINSSKGKITIKSTLPWSGDINIEVEPSSKFDLHVRIPGWVLNPIVKINSDEIKTPERSNIEENTASGYSPNTSYFLKLEKSWETGDIVKIHFPVDVNVLRYHKKVKNYGRRGTLTRGPLVYCLEDIDNPVIDIFTCVIDPTQTFEVEKGVEGFENVVTITGKTKKGKKFVAVPYFFWGNRGISKMNAVLKFK